VAKKDLGPRVHMADREINAILVGGEEDVFP